MHYFHFLMGVIVISSIFIPLQSMDMNKKKPKKIIESVNAQISCDRRSNIAAQFQKEQAELIEAFFTKNDVFAHLKPRL